MTEPLLGPQVIGTPEIIYPREFGEALRHLPNRELLELRDEMLVMVEVADDELQERAYGEKDELHKHR